jgi:hypothetical protein
MRNPKDIPPYDPWADDSEPEISRRVKMVYALHAPGVHRYAYWAEVVIDEDGLCELQDWRWGEFRDPHRPYRAFAEDRKLWDAMHEVWSWLSEWEYVELKPIGPEDSEYFATDKLRAVS